MLALRAGGQAIGWGFQLQSPVVVAGLALLMLLAGLNLSGLFEIGQKLQALGASRTAHRSDSVGAFLTGVLAVAVAAPCTAPFMAVALGSALVMPAPLALMVFLLLGLGLALPYLVLSLSPRLLARLPRPGPWMQTLKGLLAFPMYGAALWLVWVFGRQTGLDATGLLLMAGLFVVLAVWIAGQTGRRPPGLVAAALAAILALGLVIVAVGLSRPPATDRSRDTTNALSSVPWSTEAVATARAEGRPVLVNFTADWCVTCKINEGAALSSPQVAQAIAASNTVYLKADWTRRDDAITRELDRLGRSGVPLYLVYRPGESEPEILPQILTPGLVARAIGGPANP